MRANARFNNIIKSEKPVIVDFYADWCEPCKDLIPILCKLKEDYKQHVRILKVNVDSNPYIAQQYRVKAVPTVMIFYAGDLQWSKEGMVYLPEITVELEKIIQPQT